MKKLAISLTLTFAAHAGTIFNIPVDVDAPRFDFDGISIAGNPGIGRPVVPGIPQVACTEDWLINSDWDFNDACYHITSAGDLFYLGGLTSWADYDFAQLTQGTLWFASPQGSYYFPSQFGWVGYESTPRSDTPEPAAMLLTGLGLVAAAWRKRR